MRIISLEQVQQSRGVEQEKSVSKTKKRMNMKEEKIAEVNNVTILATGEAEMLIPIKPICEALGIDYSGQIKKVKEDDFLSSTVVLSTTVGADGKDREMVCLPYEYVFGWLFTINPKNVKPEAQEAVAKYRIECYDVLFRHFAEPRIFLKQQREATDMLMDKYQQARMNFRDAKQIMDAYFTEFNRVRKVTIEEWRADNRQVKINFGESKVYDD